MTKAWRRRDLLSGSLAGAAVGGLGALALQRRDEEVSTYEEFGARGDGVTDDTEALRAANAAVARRGGGVVRGRPGAVYRTRKEIRAGEGVVNDLAGAAIEAHLHEAHEAAVSVLSRSGWINGRISVVSRRPPEYQAACQAAVRAGPLVGASPSIDAIDPQEGVRGWLLQDLILETDAATADGGKVAVQILGGTLDWVCRRLSTPDHATMSGFINADWSTVGPIVSADHRMRANGEAFSARPRLGWTTHPGRGLIEDCRAGRLTAQASGGETGTTGIRLSACHDIVVRNSGAEATTFAALRIVGGDLGFEYALPSVRPRAHRGLRIEAFDVGDVLTGFGAWIDMLDDNVERSMSTHGYRRLGDLPGDGDLTLSRLTARSRSGLALAGLRLDSIHGCQVVGGSVAGFQDGLVVEYGCERVTVSGLSSTDNRRHGVFVNHHVRPPSEILLKDLVAARNGLSGEGAHVYLQHCRDTQIQGGRFGDPAVRERVQWPVRIGFPDSDNQVVGSPRFLGRYDGPNVYLG